MKDRDDVERFRSTNSRILAALGLAAAAVVPLIAIFDRNVHMAGWLVWASVLFGILVWGSMIRPALMLAEERLVLRNMFETISIPLAAVEQVAVRQVTAVLVGEKRWVSTAIGRSWRKALRSNRSSAGHPEVADPSTMAYADFVEQRIHERAAQERSRLGIANSSDEQLEVAKHVRRTPAWPEIVITAVALIGMIVAIVL